MRWLSFLLVPLLVVTAGSGLRAQSPHIGFSLNLINPTGGFASTTYPPYYSPQADRWIPEQRESYDLGFGGSFTMSWPVDRNLAVRMNFSGSSESGTNRAAGEANINLRHSQVNFGGDLQVFPQGTAYRHRGLYLLAGISADFEQFDRSFGDPQWDYTRSVRKNRLGGNVGFGHTFGYDRGMRFNLEATFHKTLTANSVSAGDPPSTDFVKIGFGWVF